MQMFLRWIAPIGLAVFTALTSFFIGSASSGANGTGLDQGVLFAASILAVIGAHAGAHLVAARWQGVDAHGPYFIPALNLSGTAGAYVKLRWPVADNRALFRIFAAGPIAGFVASSALFLAGLLFSDIVEAGPGGIFLGDSLLTYATQRIVFPAVPPGHEVLLHPVGMAGYLGLFFNMWHLFPAGRLDAGRIVYAV